ncbi:MAG TPA: Gldg family protein, partial [Phycisphaerales bacterium]|nr:Gldg family protein [Phycisphaerales bacterium]
MNWKVVSAVFRRNFNGYFQSPIGYVFICAFVLMSGFAAFWPDDFFNSNLATLHELNTYLPWILLVFIPAITMSVWADERRQGTDELLLTLPGTDLDVVCGKYLAALCIYTVALGFSLTNIAVLIGLGKPDVGVLLGNYVGYWLAGGAMLGVGMMASFMTNSLTVAFVLAMAFNVPLVFAYWAPSIIPWEGAARFIRSGSIAAQFEDFGRGLVTLSGAAYFISIAVASLYVSMVLIGRRHWSGGPKATATAMHYAVRIVSMALILIGINTLAQRVDIRADVSSGRVNSLSPQTAHLLDNLKPEHPVYVEAYVSPSVPEEYVTTRLNLLSTLREIQSLGGNKVVVKVHETPEFSEEELQAQDLYGITSRDVQSAEGGKFQTQKVILGAAVTSGLDKVVVPFFDRGIPAEYELVRSIATVCQQKRKRLGVLETEAKLFGGFDMSSMSSRPDQLIIDELRKQYDVVPVSADAEITDNFDVLLAVQPSSLTPTQMDHFIAKVRAGQPTVIFEDPFPFLDAAVTPTGQPRLPKQASPFSQPPPPEPKGDIHPLWQMLGVQFNDHQVVWQNWNPYPKFADLPKECVFIGAGSGASEPFDTHDPATAGLHQLAMLFPGSVAPLPNSGMTFTPLVNTGLKTGTVAVSDILAKDFLGRASLNENRRRFSTEAAYTLAAHITGTPAADPTPPGTTPPATAPQRGVNVVLMCDIDMLYPVFFNLRARGDNPNDPVTIRVDNVPMVLNTLDSLAGDERFLAMRTHRPEYSTL